MRTILRHSFREIFGYRITRARWLCGSILFVILACMRTIPPAPPVPRDAMNVAAPFDRTWSAVIDVFAAKNIPIRTLDRSSGFIATDRLSVGSGTLGREPHPYADCGSAQLLGYYPPTDATYNIRVKGAASSSTVQVNVLWVSTIPPSSPQCSTKGVWETELESAIKARAEAVK